MISFCTIDLVSVDQGTVVTQNWAKSYIVHNLNAKHVKTLHAIFAIPTPATMEWRKIESLFVALGAIVTEGNGSRVRFEINQVVASFHRPHPEKEAKVYQVRDARTFLEAVGITP